MCRQWRRPASDELSTEGWKDVLRQLNDIGINNVHYTGGEPLLRKDLNELVLYSSRSGFTVGMTTNGVLLDRETLEALIKAGLRSIVISIDALDADYEKIRGLPGAFPRVKDAARLISEAKAKFKIDASINYTLMRDTLESFSDVKRFADTLSLPVSVCLLDRSSYIFDIEENRKEFWIGKDEKFNNFLDALKEIKVKNSSSLLMNFPGIEYVEGYFDDPLQAKVPCASSQDRIIVDPSGSLLGGCLSMGSFGNLKNRTLKEILKDKKYIRARRNMFFKKCPGCSCGYMFNINCMPGLIIKDLFSKLARSMSERYL